jgi:hypothetical protein
MGWKVSMIIIENQDQIKHDQTILEAIGKGAYVYDKDWSLEECIRPGDKSISIGYYKDNIIICDDYQITSVSLETATNLDLTAAELRICTLFPDSEIITAACHSVVNYHGYSLIEKGVKKRLKVISSETPKIEFGPRMPEEEKLYESSYQVGEEYFWKDEGDPKDDYTEDQLMEDFTFGIAKRRLGVIIDNDDHLFWEVKFRKYINPNPIEKTDELPGAIFVDRDKEKKAKIWRTIIITTLIVLLWQAIKRVFL